MQDLFLALKQDTHDKHTQLENTPPFSLFHNLSDFNINTYANVLSVMTIFHRITAQHVSATVSETPTLTPVFDMLNTKKVANSLKRDTHDISKAANCDGKNPFANQSDTLQHASKLTFTNTKSAAIAASYVWLGSSMGANIILRRLAKHDENIPTSYYATMADCAKAWVSFKKEVEDKLPQLGLNSQVGIDTIVDDANAWFSFLIELGQAHCSQIAEVQ